MKKFIVAASLMSLALTLTILPVTSAKANSIDNRDLEALAVAFCQGVADNSASLIPAFDKQYAYFGGYGSLDHQLVAKRMALVTNYAVTDVCPQLRSVAGAKMESLFYWLREQPLNEMHPDVKMEMLTIGGAIEELTR